jgi:hypothetical protein
MEATTMEHIVLSATQTVLDHLVRGEYTQLATLTNGVRLSEEQMEEAIRQYGCHLVSHPESAYALLDIVEVRGARPRQWSVVIPLWTAEEGRSDLSLELTVIEQPSGARIELDDIHVR